MSIVSAKVSSLVASINRNSVLAEKQLLEACQRSVRCAFSRDNMDEANFIIANIPNRLRGVAVSFFKRFGLIVIENRGELPTVKRVEDKSTQKAVFEKLANVTELGLTKVSSPEDLKAKAEKADEQARKFLAENVTSDRVLAYIQSAIKLAQNKNDLEAVNALSNIAITVRAKKEVA
jgi:hypothetical protein